MDNFTFGPVPCSDGIVFRLWAPQHERVSVKVDNADPYHMEAIDGGWHQRLVSHAHFGALYKFVLPDGLEVPDPASRFQPQDVHGPSEVIDLSRHAWECTAWKGRPWNEIVVYELHVGSFTPEGTFLAAAERLDHLAGLGVTAIQLMPVHDFPGRCNWGYDGVLPYAPDATYGRPEDLMALVDAAHKRGICVFLDAVYNHFGPDGNYMAAYAPLFTDRHKTPWGDAINYDGEGSPLIRDFVIENALYWIDVFRLDGLRLDAVHEIKDDSREHLLHELSRRVREAAGDRHVHLIVENEENDSDLLTWAAENGSSLFNAQWNDDLHHVLHVAITGEAFGYYADYADDPDKLGRALAEGFVFQGEHMPYRDATRGKPSRHLPASRFISFIQNHDQIGNRAHGDRMISSRPLEAIQAAAALYLLSPQVPMLFMGEEWGASEPFPYFCDFNDQLNDDVRQGRRKELSRLPGFDEDDFLDPTAQETFASAKLDWSRLPDAASQKILGFYKALLDVRQRRIAPLLAGAPAQCGRYRREGNVVDVEWELAGGARLCLLANLTGSKAPLDSRLDGLEVIYSIGSFADGEIEPWTVVYSIRQS